MKTSVSEHRAARAVLSIFGRLEYSASRMKMCHKWVTHNRPGRREFTQTPSGRIEARILVYSISLPCLICLTADTNTEHRLDGSQRYQSTCNGNKLNNVAVIDIDCVTGEKPKLCRNSSEYKKKTVFASSQLSTSGVNGSGSP